MPEIEATPFETRFDPPRRPLRFTAFPFAQSPARLRGQHFPHMRSILGPVGGEMQQAARFHARRQQFDERRLDQPTLVMALLGPWIREPDAHFVERGLRDFVAQYLDGVVVPDSYVSRIARGQCVHQTADTRAVYLDAQVIARGIVFARPRQRLTVAEADLKHARRGATEQRIEITRFGAASGGNAIDPEACPVFRERTPLCEGYPTLSQHKTADGARMFGAVGVVRTGAQAIIPSTGLDADA